LYRTGRSSINARFKSAVVTGRTAFPGNLVFGPETTALTPPTGDFHIHAAADALNIVFPGFFDFEEAGQAELTFHAVTAFQYGFPM
jgi:hypothetical protein